MQEMDDMDNETCISSLESVDGLPVAITIIHSAGTDLHISLSIYFDREHPLLSPLA